MIDKIAFRLLKALYKRDLDESEVNKIIKRTDFTRPDPRLYQLEKDHVISVHGAGGIEDGEGGYLDGTVKFTYHLEPNGRAEVERVRKSHLKWMIGTGIALAAAIGAILSALPNLAC